jgi:uncharacterized protein involved in cysteine biosynthesis
MDSTSICARCGYQTVQPPCPVCGGGPADARFAGFPARGLQSALDGLRAPYVGARVLYQTQGTKRWLVPPVVAVVLGFAGLGWWAVTRVWAWLEQLSIQGEALLAGDAWWQSVAQWIGPAALVGVAQWSSFLVAVVVLLLVATFTFSVVYEACCGPFLDVVQARVETHWYGRDPRSHAATWSTLRAVRASMLSSLLALSVLVAFVWVQFVPVVGPPLYAGIAGFSTALTLLDIPLSRRSWTVRRRLAFVVRYLVPVTMLGLSTGLLFLIPVLGPLVAVPSASIGGLWLLHRLDKST